MKNIAIVLKGRRNFGDLVCYLPLILKLKEAHIDCKVTLLGHFEQCKLLCFPGAADEFVDYSKISSIHLIKLLKGNYDHVINFNTSSVKVNTFINLFCNSKNKTSVSLEKVYNTYTAYKVLSAIDSNPQDTKIIAKLSSHKNTNEKFLTLLPGGGGTTGKGIFKRWNIKHFISTAEKITSSDEEFSKIVFILGDNEKKYIDDIPQSINDIPVIIALNYPIPDLIDIAINSRLAIANDCGPSHIFHMLEKTMVTIFGWETEKRSPYNVINTWFLTRENATFVIPPYFSKNIDDVKEEQVSKLSQLLLSNTTNGV